MINNSIGYIGADTRDAIWLRCNEATFDSAKGVAVVQDDAVFFSFQVAITAALTAGSNTTGSHLDFPGCPPPSLFGPDITQDGISPMVVGASFGLAGPFQAALSPHSGGVRVTIVNAGALDLPAGTPVYFTGVYTRAAMPSALSIAI